MTKHKARQKERIIIATMALIQKEGLGKVNISGIAESAGMTRQTIYNYFADVEAIIAEMLTLHSNTVKDKVLENMAKEQSSRQKLLAFVDFKFLIAPHKQEFNALEAMLSVGARAEIDSHDTSIKNALEEIVRSGLKSGEFHNAKPSSALMEMIVGIVEVGAATSAKYPHQKSKLLEVTILAMFAIL